MFLYRPLHHTPRWVGQPKATLCRIACHFRKNFRSGSQGLHSSKAGKLVTSIKFIDSVITCRSYAQIYTYINAELFDQ